LLVASNENGILCIDPIVLGMDTDSNNVTPGRELVLLQALYTRALASQQESQELCTQNQQLRSLIRGINANINERLDAQTTAFQRIIQRVLIRPARPVAPNVIMPNTLPDAAHAGHYNRHCCS
jgi:hypothetical protein